jgi:hypothetical protein
MSNVTTREQIVVVVGAVDPDEYDHVTELHVTSHVSMRMRLLLSLLPILSSGNLGR